MPADDSRPVFRLALSDDERRIWQAAADRAGIALSELVRHAVAEWLYQRELRRRPPTSPQDAPDALQAQPLDGSTLYEILTDRGGKRDL